MYALYDPDTLALIRTTRSARRLRAPSGVTFEDASLVPVGTLRAAGVYPVTDPGLPAALRRATSVSVPAQLASADEDVALIYEGPEWTEEDRAAEIDAAIGAKRAEILAESAVRLHALVEGYTAAERETWHQQQAEAAAWTADAQAPAPLLRAIAAARGLDMADLVARVEAKADTFAAAGGAVLGAQQALEDRLEAIAVTWTASPRDAPARATAETALAAIDPADPAEWPAMPGEEPAP